MWPLILLLLATSASARKIGGGGGYGKTNHASYPHSTGYSGTGTGGAHTYPASTGHSGNNHVPKQTVTYQQNTNYAKNTEVHHHYHNHHYSPPSHIGYGSQTYPVYQSPPPVYVYQYRDSGSRFDTLLTGLALYNLGRMSASHSNYDHNREYRNNPGEICKLGIRRSNGDYEETRVECRLMTSFIYDAPMHTQNANQHSEHKITTTTVVNVTHTEGGRNSNSTTVTVTNTTVVNALDAKGESIKVTPEMSCYLIRISRDTSTMRKEIPCTLLQKYAQDSWKNDSERLTPILTLFIFQIFLFQVM